MNKEEIKFSVVIPVYNASEFLKETLDSVNNQTYKNYEVLVINDGSNDDTEKILKNYKRVNPKFPLRFITQKNSGVSLARNNAIFHARGDFIAFLDQDDWWFPKKLEKIAKILKINKEIDILYHNMIIEQWKDNKELWKSRILKEPVYNDLLFNGNKLGISATIVKLRKVLDIGGFSENLIYVEDYDLWLRLARKKGVFYYMPDALSKYFWRKGAESNKVENFVQEVIEITEHFFNLLKKENKYNIRFLNKKLNRRKSDILFTASRRHYSLKNYKKALEYSLKAFNEDYTFWKPYVGVVLSYLKSKVLID